MQKIYVLCALRYVWTLVHLPVFLTCAANYWYRLWVWVSIVSGYGMKNKERKGEEVCKHCSLALFYRVFAILLHEVGAHARLHAGMWQAVVQRETQTGLHLHANTTRIRKGQFRVSIMVNMSAHVSMFNKFFVSHYTPLCVYWMSCWFWWIMAFKEVNVNCNLR